MLQVNDSHIKDRQHIHHHKLKEDPLKDQKAKADSSGSDISDDDR